MVDDEIQRAQELRQVAARLTLLAQQTRSPDPRRELLDLAERFDNLARTLAGDRSPEPEA